MENSELNFVKSSSEMVPHIALDVIFEKGGAEAVTMNGGVGRGLGSQQRPHMWVYLGYICCVE